MFAVHGQNFYTVFARLVHHDFTSHHENFFRRDGDVFARANRGERRLQSRCADDGDEHNIGSRQRGEPEQTFVAAENLRGRAERVLQCLRLRRIGNGNAGRLVFARLFEEQIGIATRREPMRRICSGKSSATFTVLVPIEPVLPRRTTFFMDA